jgi:hypothetical protein
MFNHLDWTAPVNVAAIRAHRMTVNVRMLFPAMQPATTVSGRWARARPQKSGRLQRYFRRMLESHRMMARQLP